MIVIVADERGQHVGDMLGQALDKKGLACSLFAVDDRQPAPCLGCGSCSGKSYGRCVIKDDMEALYRAIANCDAYILAGPVLFGGYSYPIKKVLDRLSALGDPRYYSSQGELVKGMRHRARRFYALGCKPGCDDIERQAFTRLHQENLRIMQLSGQAFVLDEAPDVARMAHIAERIAHG